MNGFLPCVIICCQNEPLPAEVGVVLYGRQNMSDLMFKKKLLLLITELVVILKYLDQLYDQLCDHKPPPSAKINNKSCF